MTRRMIAAGAAVVALALPTAATAGGPTPIETTLGNATRSIVVCIDNPPGWSTFSIVAGRPVITTWSLWCNSMARSLAGQKALDAGVIQGWQALATQQGKVACWHRIHRYDVCEAGEPVAAATAATRVPSLMRKAGATKARYIAKVAKAVQASIDEGS